MVEPRKVLVANNSKYQPLMLVKGHPRRGRLDERSYVRVAQRTSKPNFLMMRLRTRETIKPW